VGFDNGDDLGMKGSDSAMPIWADFMKEALARHPEWNGDWAMPVGIRKAEIDVRNGSLIRELDAVQAVETAATPTPNATPEDPAWAVEPTTREVEVVDSNVPAEFRRVELFIAGTVPGRVTRTESDLPPDMVYQEIEPSEEPRPTPTPTPISGTWQDVAEPEMRPRERPTMSPQRRIETRPTPRRLPGNVEYIPDRP
jgi:hypothetical protein